MSYPNININGITREMTPEEYTAYVQACQIEEEIQRALPPSIEERTSAMEEAVLGLLSNVM